MTDVIEKLAALYSAEHTRYGWGSSDETWKENCRSFVRCFIAALADELDENCLNNATKAYWSAVHKESNDIEDGVEAAIRAYLTALKEQS